MIDSINGYNPINQSQSLSNQKPENSENSLLFRQLLSKAALGQHGTGETNNVIAEAEKKMETNLLAEIASVSNLSFNDTSSVSTVENETDELIEKLSFYSNQLEKSSISLKDINSLIEEIKTSAENLLQKAEDSGNADQELIDIVRECAIAAHSEYIKFQRGDYIENYV